MFFSKTTSGFYSPAIHEIIPDDVVEISIEKYEELLAGQSQGKQISADDSGFPILTDAEVIQLSFAERRAREYPPITDYLDGVVKGDQAQIDAYIAACQAVKAKYPKPESV